MARLPFSKSFPVTPWMRSHESSDQRTPGVEWNYTALGMGSAGSGDALQHRCIFDVWELQANFNRIVVSTSSSIGVTYALSMLRTS